MSSPDQTTTPSGAACTNCGAALAPDQRYCLECGTRRAGIPPPSERAGAALASAEPTPSAAAPAPVQQPPPEPPRRDFSPLAAVFGIALLGGMLLIGVLLGREGSEDDPPPAQTVQVGEGQTTTTTPSETETPEVPPTGAIVSEWPAGTDGFTITLQALPKDGTTSADVDQAKSDLTAQGATAVGVLDSDLYPSLDPGEYVIYSGVYTDRAAAKTALKSLEGTVPEAALAQVSATPTQGE